MPPVGPIIEGAPVHGYEAIVLPFGGKEIRCLARQARIKGDRIYSTFRSASQMGSTW